MLRLEGFALLLVLPLLAQEQPQDPGRPVVRRGGPAQKREPVPPPAEQRVPQPPYREVIVDEEGRSEKVVSGAPVPAAGGLLERARDAAFDFDKTLPNFICDQLVSRYESKTLKPQWKLRDRVQLELVYVTGKEDYRNIRINGKPLKKGSPEESGSWSTGDFGSTLVSLFGSTMPADFRFRGASQAAGMAAQVYDFSVPQPRSHWTIRYGTAIRPAFQGSVWIDPESARVLRIEMSSRRLPSTYEIDSVEMTVDYGWVSLSGKSFLLPVRSENLACVRGTFNCMKNEIEFRNYRKFEVESQVLQVESEITFPESDDAAKPKSKTTPPSITPQAPPRKKQEEK